MTLTEEASTLKGKINEESCCSMYKWESPATFAGSIDSLKLNVSEWEVDRRESVKGIVAWNRQRLWLGCHSSVHAGPDSTKTCHRNQLDTYEASSPLNTGPLTVENALFLPKSILSCPILVLVPKESSSSLLVVLLNERLKDVSALRSQNGVQGSSFDQIVNCTLVPRSSNIDNKSISGAASSVLSFQCEPLIAKQIFSFHWHGAPGQHILQLNRSEIGIFQSDGTLKVLNLQQLSTKIDHEGERNFSHCLLARQQEASMHPFLSHLSSQVQSCENLKSINVAINDTNTGQLTFATHTFVNGQWCAVAAGFSRNYGDGSVVLRLIAFSSESEAPFVSEIPISFLTLEDQDKCWMSAFNFSIQPPPDEGCILYTSCQSLPLRRSVAMTDSSHLPSTQCLSLVFEGQLLKCAVTLDTGDVVVFEQLLRNKSCLSTELNEEQHQHCPDLPIYFTPIVLWPSLYLHLCRISASAGIVFIQSRPTQIMLEQDYIEMQRQARCSGFPQLMSSFFEKRGEITFAFFLSTCSSLTFLKMMPVCNGWALSCYHQSSLSTGPILFSAVANCLEVWQASKDNQSLRLNLLEIIRSGADENPQAYFFELCNLTQKQLKHLWLSRGRSKDAYHFEFMTFELIEDTAFVMSEAIVYGTDVAMARIPTADFDLTAMTMARLKKVWIVADARLKAALTLPEDNLLQSFNGRLKIFHLYCDITAQLQDKFDELRMDGYVVSWLPWSVFCSGDHRYFRSKLHSSAADGYVMVWMIDLLLETSLISHLWSQSFLMEAAVDVFVSLPPLTPLYNFLAVVDSKSFYRSMQNPSPQTHRRILEKVQTVLAWADSKFFCMPLISRILAKAMGFPPGSQNKVSSKEPAFPSLPEADDALMKELQNLFSTSIQNSFNEVYCPIGAALFVLYALCQQFNEWTNRLKAVSKVGSKAISLYEKVSLANFVHLSALDRLNLILMSLTPYFTTVQPLHDPLTQSFGLASLEMNGHLLQNVFDEVVFLPNRLLKLQNRNLDSKCYHAQIAALIGTLDKQTNINVNNSHSVGVSKPSNKLPTNTEQQLISWHTSWVNGIAHSFRKDAAKSVSNNQNNIQRLANAIRGSLIGDSDIVEYLWLLLSSMNYSSTLTLFLTNLETSLGLSLRSEIESPPIPFTKDNDSSDASWQQILTNNSVEVAWLSRFGYLSCDNDFSISAKGALSKPGTGSSTQIALSARARPSFFPFLLLLHVIEGSTQSMQRRIIDSDILTASIFRFAVQHVQAVMRLPMYCLVVSYQWYVRQVPAQSASDFAYLEQLQTNEDSTPSSAPKMRSVLSEARESNVRWLDSVKELLVICDRLRHTILPNTSTSLLQTSQILWDSLARAEGSSEHGTDVGVSPEKSSHVPCQMHAFNGAAVECKAVVASAKSLPLQLWIKTVAFLLDLHMSILQSVSWDALCSYIYTAHCQHHSDSMEESQEIVMRWRSRAGKTGDIFNGSFFRRFGWCIIMNVWPNVFDGSYQLFSVDSISKALHICKQFPVTDPIFIQIVEDNPNDKLLDSYDIAERKAIISSRQQTRHLAEIILQLSDFLEKSLRLGRIMHHISLSLESGDQENDILSAADESSSSASGETLVGDVCIQPVLEFSRAAKDRHVSWNVNSAMPEAMQRPHEWDAKETDSLPLKSAVNSQLILPSASCVTSRRLDFTQPDVLACTQIFRSFRYADLKLLWELLANQNAVLFVSELLLCQPCLAMLPHWTSVCSMSECLGLTNEAWSNFQVETRPLSRFIPPELEFFSGSVKICIYRTLAFLRLRKLSDGISTFMQLSEFLWSMDHLNSGNIAYRRVTGTLRRCVEVVRDVIVQEYYRFLQCLPRHTTSSNGTTETIGTLGDNVCRIVSQTLVLRRQEPLDSSYNEAKIEKQSAMTPDPRFMPFNRFAHVLKLSTAGHRWKPRGLPDLQKVKGVKKKQQQMKLQAWDSVKLSIEVHKTLPSQIAAKAAKKTLDVLSHAAVTVFSKGVKVTRGPDFALGHRQSVNETLKRPDLFTLTRNHVDLPLFSDLKAVGTEGKEPTSRALEHGSHILADDGRQGLNKVAQGVQELQSGEGELMCNPTWEDGWSDTEQLTSFDSVEDVSNERVIRSHSKSLSRPLEEKAEETGKRRVETLQNPGICSKYVEVTKDSLDAAGSDNSFRKNSSLVGFEELCVDSKEIRTKKPSIDAFSSFSHHKVALAKDWAVRDFQLSSSQFISENIPVKASSINNQQSLISSGDDPDNTATLIPPATINGVGKCVKAISGNRHSTNGLISVSHSATSKSVRQASLPSSNSPFNERADIDSVKDYSGWSDDLQVDVELAASEGDESPPGLTNLSEDSLEQGSVQNEGHDHSRGPKKMFHSKQPTSVFSVVSPVGSQLTTKTKENGQEKEDAKSRSLMLHGERGRQQRDVLLSENCNFFLDSNETQRTSRAQRVHGGNLSALDFESGDRDRLENNEVAKQCLIEDHSLWDEDWAVEFPELHQAETLPANSVVAISQFDEVTEHASSENHSLWDEDWEVDSTELSHAEHLVACQGVVPAQSEVAESEW